MHKNLVSQAFQKAKADLGSDKITHLSKHLSDYIVEDSKAPYGEKALRISYNKISKNTNEKIYLKEHAAEALSRYLGFINYADFLQKNSNEHSSKISKSQNFLKRNTLVIFFSLVFIAALFTYNSATKQKWMVWQDNHYIEVDFDTEKYKINQLKFYKKERIQNFKKINPTCDTTQFFNEDGSVKIWYGKNRNKKLEYFTALGLHPETGKTLRPITQYMIDKYICD